MRHTVSGHPERPTVLFLHGFLGSSADWNDVVAALEKDFYCLVVDLPGHGDSLRLSPGSYTMEGASRSSGRAPG